jgi:hypothetical protein
MQFGDQEMMVWRVGAFILVLALSTGACVSAGTTLLHRPTGGLQCDAHALTRERLNAEVAALRARGVPVHAGHCGHDGMGRIALCGVTRGDLFTIEVRPDAVSAALRAGYRLPDEYPHARLSTCVS